MLLRTLYALPGLSLLLLALLPAIATAADQHETGSDHATLETMTITSRPPGSQSLEHTSQPISVLAGEALERRQANSLGETLDREPGVTGNHFGAGASRPIIRGLDGPRVQILQDGISTLDVSTISADHQATVEPFQAEQIEIMRGPATLLYGSGAAGGLVNVVTGRIPEYVPEFEAGMLGQYESANNGKVLGLRARGGIDELAVHFDSLKRDTHDYEAAEGRVRNSFVETEDINFGTSWVGSRGFFGFSVGRYDSTYGIPIDPGEPDEAAFIDLTQDRYDFAGRLDNPFSGLRSIDFRSGYNDYTHTEFERPGEPGTVFRNKAWETRVAFNHAPIGPLLGAVGLQHRHRDFDATGEEAFVPPAKEQSLALFLFEDTDWHDWHFEFGGRVEHQIIDPDAAAGNGDIDHTVYSVSAGSLWNFTPGYAAGLTISRAQRPPALEELLADGPHLATGTFEIGNTGLSEETSNNLDLSLRKNDGRLTWRTNIFVNYIEDFIFVQEQDLDGDGVADEVDEDGNPGGELLLANYTQANALFYGVEAEIMYGLFDDARGSLDARLFGDWVRGRLSRGEDLPRISPARLGLGLDYHRGRFQADVEGVYVFAQEDTAPLESKTGDYTLLEAGVGYTLARNPARATVFLRGSNLLDEDARRHTSFIKDRAPLMGRSVMAGIRAQF